MGKVTMLKSQMLLGTKCSVLVEVSNRWEEQDGGRSGRQSDCVINHLMGFFLFVPFALANSQKVTCWETDLMSMTGRKFQTSM